MNQSQHNKVLELENSINPKLLMQLYPDIYFEYLDIFVTSCYYVNKNKGQLICQELINLSKNESLRNKFDQHLNRLKSNLNFYSPDYSSQLVLNLSTNK